MNNLEFQIYDYRELHIKEGEYTSSVGEYNIQVFGRTLEGESVYCRLTGFKPRFYIKVPDNWNKTHCDKLIKWLKNDSPIPYNVKKGIVNGKIFKRCDPQGFTNGRLYKFICIYFENVYSMRNVSGYFEERKISIPGLLYKKKEFKLYESNLLPMIRCFHIQDIPGCGWVRPENYKLIEEDEEKESRCNIEIVLDWKDLKCIKKEVNAPFRILSFDIECYSADGSFPNPKRGSDKIIQIGSTYTLIGKSETYREHIVVLNSCDDIEGAIVDVYNNEKNLILGWIKELTENDADILTGYNIFYFDEHYIRERSKYLNIDLDVSFLSKLKNYKCNFKETKLASSALGENLLRFYDTPGLVHIDLMKDVQKTYNLSSYKLDKVASNFINGNVKSLKKVLSKSKYNLYELECNHVKDLYKDDYIHLELKAGFVNDDIGEKFMIKEIEDNKLIIKVEKGLDLEEECDFSKGEIIWSQAKDDVPPQDIFRLQNTDSKGRYKIARYCLKDCRLVNLLVNKLEVVTKNIEMANVCYVPFQYLFTRGQGVKLFSLVTREYRKYKYLFPKLKVLSDEEKEILGSFEGAIVFDPIPSVSYQALAVKDYASLYPSSIIHKNMSHETKVKDSSYDNLEGVKYFNAKFRTNTGDIEYRRFARVEGEIGIIPRILKNLLGERKAVKKEMKTEKDPFRYSILDAKQLALKVTANSLYGQLGAATSPVRDRDIAACTTSTGREMLILAKKYDEEILPWVLNGFRECKGDKEREKILRNLFFKDPEDEKLMDSIREYLELSKDYLCNPEIKYGDTDSIFSCYNYKEGYSLVSKNDSLEIFKNIIEFGLYLIKPFMPKDYKEDFDRLYELYYGDEKIKRLSYPRDLKPLEKPEHYSIVLEKEELLKQFLKEYVEESYLPWLWTLQNMFNMDLSYLSKKDYNNLLDIKINKVGYSMIEKMELDRINVRPRYLEESEFNRLVERLKNFLRDYLKDYVIYPYYGFNSSNNLVKKIRIYKGGSYLKDKRSLSLSIKLGILSGNLVKRYLEEPQDLEYEKTFYPYLILTKKRYVGNKYEFDENKYKLDYMGIVLKRRDNAPIVKEICSGVINRLIVDREPDLALKFALDNINKMIKGEFNIKYFLQSRTLKMKTSYADWKKIAHVVLSERIGIRDEGNKPQSGDRITFAAIQVKNGNKLLQGDRIETPEYIMENNLKIDYMFYLTNQIETPVLQFLSLACPNAREELDKLKMSYSQELKGVMKINNFIKYI